MSAPYGKAPLGYQGLKEKNPPDIFFFDKAPTTRDFKLFDLGDIWIDQSTTPDPQVYMLVDKAINVATWILFTAGAGGVLNQLTASLGADPVVIPTAGNINILQGSGITTTGVSPTITIATSGIVGTSFPTNSGTAAPSGGVLNILGGTGISTAGAGNTVTITATATPSFTWTIDTTSPISVNADEGHISSTVPITYNLPPTCTVGDEFAFVQLEAVPNIFTLQAQAGQTIRVGNLLSSVAGTVSSTDIGDTLELLCVATDTQFIVRNSIGNFNLT